MPSDAGGLDRLIERLYASRAGRAALSLLARPGLSRAVGRFMDGGFSRVLIKPLARKYAIDASVCERARYSSYNEFFTRRVKPGLRPVEGGRERLVSPSDGRLTVFELREGARFRVKGLEYTLSSLLRDERLANSFAGGWIFIFRLTVADLHRYAYAASGRKGGNVHIGGVFHTVNPTACALEPVYAENEREYTVIDSDAFGELVQMEVGAMMVGRIVNLDGPKEVARGDEKGRFEFGGSTIILALRRGAAVPDADILKNTAEGFETAVKLGEGVASAAEGGGKRSETE